MQRSIILPGISLKALFELIFVDKSPVEIFQLLSHTSIMPKRKTVQKDLSSFVKTEKKNDTEKSKKQKTEDTTEKKPINKTETDYSEMDLKCERKSESGLEWNLKIASWNVVSLKSVTNKNGMEFIEREDPDIMCFQETKCSEKKCPDGAKPDGYHRYFVAGDKEGYAGVALYTKVKPLKVSYGLNNKEFDSEGRVITAEFEKFHLVTTYVPNAGRGLVTLPKRLNWNPVFQDHLKKLDETKPVILCGDLNVAHQEIDLKNPKTNTKTAGFTAEERAGFTELLDQGFVDSFRCLYPEKDEVYTYWNYIGNARSRNTGCSKS